MTEKDFIIKWINLLNKEGIKKFPDDFLRITKYKNIDTPRKTLVLGKEFFGIYEVITTDGEEVYQTQSFAEAKFVVYAARNRSGKIKLPNDIKLLSKIIQQYENYIDIILTRIEKDYNILFPSHKNFYSLSNEIFRVVNLIRY